MAAGVEFVKVKCEVEVKREYPEDLETETKEEYQNEEYNCFGKTENFLPIKTDPDLSSTAEPAGIDEASVSFKSCVEEENEYILSDNPFIPETSAENHQQLSTETEPSEIPKINFGLFRTQFNQKIELLECPETSIDPIDCPYTCTFCEEKFKRLNDLSRHLVNCAARKSARQRNVDGSPFLCVFCGLKFKLISQRTKHLSFCTAARSSLKETANDDDSKECSAGVNFKSVDKSEGTEEEKSLKNKLSSDSLNPTSRLASRYVYVCHKCHAEFDEKCQLQQHFGTQHPANPSEVSLKRPAEESLSKPFTYCGVTFNVESLTKISNAESSSESSKNPLNPAESSRPFVCPHCRSRFTFRWNLQAHLSTCTAPVSSDKDLKTASLTFMYGGLKYKLHKDPPQRFLGSSPVTYPFVCKHCTVKFKLSEDLIKHLSVCSKRKSSTGKNSEVKSAGEYRPFICVSCEMQCKTRKELYEHTCNLAECWTENNSKPIKVSVPEPVNDTKENSIDDPFPNAAESSEDMKELFHCYHCDAEFTQKSDLRTHFETHRPTDDFPHICAECGTKFKRFYNYEKHVSMHTKHFMCNMCSVSFDSLCLLEEHTATHPLEDAPSENSSHGPDNFSVKHKQIYECGVCRIVFSEAKLLKQHVSTHSEEYFECSQCPAKLRSESLLRRHKQQHGKSLTCSQCPAAFVRPHNLEAHMKTHSNDAPAEKLDCEWCSITFTSTIDLAKHLIIHTRERDYVCEDCGKGFSQPSKLEAHQLKHTEGKPFSCPHCPKRFRFLQFLRRHVRKHTGEKPYACEFCAATFTELSTLRVHTRTHTQEKSFPCSYCPARFAHNTALLAHVRIHTGKEPYRCELCSKTFKQLSQLEKHKGVHKGKNCFSCDQCSATFRGERYLKAHKLMHEKKLYTCATCDRKFSRKSSLKVHLQKHTQPQKIYCDVCSATFDRQSHLERHMRVHTREKPFACTHCGARFSQKVVLIKHERIHTGEKPYTCSHCLMKFSWRDSWLSHIKIHTGENLFSCEICSVQFNNKTTLQKHLKTHGGESFYDESRFEKIIVKEEHD